MSSLPSYLLCLPSVLSSLFRCFAFRKCCSFNFFAHKVFVSSIFFVHSCILRTLFSCPHVRFFCSFFFFPTFFFFSSFFLFLFVLAVAIFLRLVFSCFHIFFLFFFLPSRFCFVLFFSCFVLFYWFLILFSRHISSVFIVFSSLVSHHMCMTSITLSTTTLYVQQQYVRTALFLYS